MRIKRYISNKNSVIMYNSKILNPKMVDNNAYITIGDPYHDPKQNMFRQDDPKAKKTSDKPFASKVCCNRKRLFCIMTFF